MRRIPLKKVYFVPTLIFCISFFSNVDAAFSEMSTIGKTLTNSTVVQQFAFRSKADMELPSVEAYYLNEAVNSFKQKEFENICIYFPEFSRVYNGRNGLALEDFI